MTQAEGLPTLKRFQARAPELEKLYLAYSALVVIVRWAKVQHASLDLAMHALRSIRAKGDKTLDSIGKLPEV